MYCMKKVDVHISLEYMATPGWREAERFHSYTHVI